MKKLEVGKTVESGTLRVHRYRDSVKLEDLTNAGKRGKKVRVASVGLGYAYQGDRDKWLDRLGSTLAELTSFATAMQVVTDMQRTFPDLELHEREERGIDVKVGGIRAIEVRNFYGIEIKADTYRFRLTNCTPIGRRRSANDQDLGPVDCRSYYSLDRASAEKFYRWLTAHVQDVDNMTMRDFSRLFGELGLKYDSH